MIKAEFSDTEKEFKWRLVFTHKNGEISSSDWYSLYSGLLIWKAPDGVIYGLATQYWDGSGLPIEVPFIVSEVSKENA